MVKTDTSREPDTSLQSVDFDESAGPVLDHLSDLGHRHPRLDGLLDVSSDLSMNLGSPADRIIILG
jgi:hypothetical protein